jgi:hypothetical protein
VPHEPPVYVPPRKPVVPVKAGSEMREGTLKSSTATVPHSRAQARAQAHLQQQLQARGVLQDGHEVMAQHLE